MISWHRYYDPETGRYISADPIGLDGGINLYAYVENDPVNWIDPWGLRYARGPLRGPVRRGPPTPFPRRDNLLTPFGDLPDPSNPNEKPLFSQPGGFGCTKWVCRRPDPDNQPDEHGICPTEPEWDDDGPWLSNPGSPSPSNDPNCYCAEGDYMSPGYR